MKFADKTVRWDNLIFLHPIYVVATVYAGDDDFPTSLVASQTTTADGLPALVSSKAIPMMGDILTLDCNSDDGSVWLVLTSPSGLQHKKLIWLRDGFTVDDVYEAVLATGWIKQLGDKLYLASDLSCEQLRDIVEAMLGYFEEPGVPGIALREIHSNVSEYDAVHDLRQAIPLYAYAWLDVMVREDLADAARSAQQIWLNTKFVIDVPRYCNRRVSELVARYSQLAAPSPTGALAPSISTRKSGESRARIG